MTALRFSLLHTKKLEELQGHKTTKETPEKQEDSSTTKCQADTELLGKTSETASSEQTCIYGFMAASQLQAHLGWRVGRLGRPCAGYIFTIPAAVWRE